MATEHDPSETDLGIRPQTPAGRRGNPAGSRQRTAADRERLRAESRARRRAREHGDGGTAVAEPPAPGPPEPRAAQITVRRLSDYERARPESAPSAPPDSAPSGPPQSAPSAAPESAPSAPPESRPAPEPRANRPAPATPAAERGIAERDAAERELAERDPANRGIAERDAAERDLAERDPANRGIAERDAAQRELAERDPTQRDLAERDLAEPDLAERDLAERDLADRDAAAGAAEAGERALLEAKAPPAAPASPPPSAPPSDRPPREPFALSLPTDPRERGVLVLALASAVGVIVALAASLGSGDVPGFGGSGMRLEGSASAVAPGGWLRVEGAGAPADARLVLESRSPGGDWRPFGEGSADGDGDFALEGRVLERPGRVQLRARAPGVAAASPLPVTVRPLRLASVGDINLGDVPGDAIAANGPRYPWEGVGKALREADVSFGNLESAISTRGEPFPKEYNFRGTPAALAGLRRHSGIDVLNLANNHVGDFGPEATVDTVKAVERLGMRAVGAGPDLRRALQPQVVERLGLEVAFVGFSEIAPLEFAAQADRPGTAWATPEAIVKAVQAARRKADVVVATFHWGIEKQTLETARQRELADVAVRAGAQVVIGAHPHTLQPVRRQGGAIVAYSLGNFVFGAQSPETSTTGILQLGLTAEGVAKASWHPARISGGRPMPEGDRPMRIPLRDGVAMEAGVNLF